MMRGMSSEKPAEERFLLMDHIWSAYEVTGEVTMKIGAMCVMIHFSSDMVLRRMSVWPSNFSMCVWRRAVRDAPANQA